MRYLPFKMNTFDAIVCDPPHMDTPPQSFMFEKYGSWNRSDIIRTMKLANIEFARVLKPKGLLLLKIFKKDYQLYETLLSNFTFFLPIEFTSKSNLSKVEVGWYIGVLKQDENLMLQLSEDVPPPRSMRQLSQQSSHQEHQTLSAFLSQP